MSICQESESTPQLARDGWLRISKHGPTSIPMGFNHTLAQLLFGQKRYPRVGGRHAELKY